MKQKRPETGAQQLTACHTGGGLISNEEIAAKVQQGQDALISTLWDRVKPFVAKLAKERIRAFPSRACDVDDLIQAGFLGLLEAVRTYRTDMECTFLTWLAYHLKNEFNDAMGVRTEKQKRDPIHTCRSLDEPLTDEPDGATLGDTVADPRDYFSDAEGMIWLEQLRTALDSALADLPEDQRAVIEARYYCGLTLAEVADDFQVTGNAVRQREQKAMRSLRNGKHRRQLEAFRETMGEVENILDRQTNFYKGMGPTRFRETWSSGVEWLTLRRDGMRRSMLRDRGIFD